MEAKENVMKVSFTDRVIRVISKFVKILNGQFGRKTLKNPYRAIWKVFAWGLFAFIVLRCILVPAMEWWDGVVENLNYLIWG